VWDYSNDDLAVPVLRGKHVKSTEVSMSKPMVLARASQGEPLVRTVISEGESVIYLANPNRVAEVLAGQTDPIGFPREDVFSYDAGMEERLLNAWQSGAPVDDLWRDAEPYRAISKPEKVH
jgi:hypothetical protein